MWCGATSVSRETPSDLVWLARETFRLWPLCLLPVEQREQHWTRLGDVAGAQRDDHIAIPGQTSKLIGGVGRCGGAHDVRRHSACDVTAGNTEVVRFARRIDVEQHHTIS